MRALACSLVALLGGAACDQTVDGNQPVGGDTATPAEIERFSRRLHLDLTGATAADDYVADARSRIETTGNTTSMRRTLADELLAAPEFADVFVTELENRVYGGETADQRYDFLCAIIRDDPPCDTCGPPGAGQNLCEGCSCQILTDLAAERATIAAARADLAGGMSTGAIERRYAESLAFRALAGGSQNIAASVFEAFLGHPGQAEEIAGGAAMVDGIVFQQGAPAGLLYHRHGSNFMDFIDIVFDDEVYREAIVIRSFERYLGRTPTPVELRYFAATIDAANPDLRSVVLAITSSREYFQP
jgi:hypothetical protein